LRASVERGLKVAAIVDSPKVMTEGNWRLGMFVDERAGDEQMEKLTAVFGGQKGGPMELIPSLVGEMLGVERAPFEVVEDGLRHSVKIGDAIEFEIEDIVPFGVETGQPVRLVGVFHPALSEFNARGKALERSAPSASNMRGSRGSRRLNSPGPPEGLIAGRTAALIDRCFPGIRAGNRRLTLVFGDSVPEMLKPSLQVTARRADVKLVDAAVPGCGVVTMTQTDATGNVVSWQGDCDPIAITRAI
jgi:hypothetical protein